MNYQEVLMISTNGFSLRSEAIGWTIESGLEASKAGLERQDKYGDYCSIPVGLLGYSKEFCSYPTVLHALGKGWKLLTPPERYHEKWTNNADVNLYLWWLVREVGG